MDCIRQHQQRMRFCSCDGKWNMADDCIPGRKRTPTDSAVKNNQKRIQTNYNKTRINIVRKRV